MALRARELWNSSFVRKEEKSATTLVQLFEYWREMLINRIVRIFEWNGLPFEQHELELTVIMGGLGFVAHHNDKTGIIAGVGGSVYGVTRYPDVYAEVTYALPGENGKSISGTRKLGKDAVMLRNTSLSMGMSNFIDRYASLLAHGDLSYKAALISGRLQDVLTAGDSSSVESIKQYYDGKYNGEPKAILDKTLMEIQGGITNVGRGNSMPDYMNILDAQNEVLRAFYRDLGIRWTRQKRGNMTEDEVDSDGQMLLFNISDMLHQREKFCQEYNRIFAGRADKISVKISSELENLVDTESVEKDEREEVVNDSN